MLGEEKVSKLFIKFVIPSIIAMVIIGSQSIIDGIFIGNFIGEIGLASVNISQPFISLANGISIVASLGCLSFLGRSLGDKDEEKAQDIFKTSFIFLTITNIILGVVGFACSTILATLLGAEGEIIQHASNYIRILSMFIPILGIMFLFGYTGRVLGKPELFLIGTVVSIVVNICLNYILVATLKLGTTGAALATGMAYSSIVLIVISPVLKKESVINVFKGKFDSKLILPVLYNGSSEGVNSASVAISTLLFNLAFMEIAGVAGVAAFTAISYVAMFCSFLMFGISDGITTLISYNFGSKQHDRVREILKLSFIVEIAISIVLFLALYIFGENLVSLFINDSAEVLAFASVGAKIYAFAFLVNGINIIISGYFTAIGDAKSSIIIAINKGLIFVVIGITILPRIFGIQGIWATVPFAEMSTFFIGLYYIIKKNNLE